MSDFITLAQGRRSIRRYLDDPVPDADIERFIDAAVAAPSGCNSQCWNFVAVRDKTVMASMATAVVEEMQRFYAPVRPAESEAAEFDSLIATRGRAATFFTQAPLVIAVFMTKLAYHEPRITALFGRKGYSHEAMMERLSWPDVLSIGAAIQNMLLAIHELGYGACWMNEPAIAAGRMNEVLGVPPEQRFVSIIPVGRPAIAPRPKTMKDRASVFTLIG